MHILLYGDSARSTTGYGQQLRGLGGMLQRQGHTVSQVAILPLPFPPEHLPSWLQDPGFEVFDLPGQTGWEAVQQQSADLLLSLTDDYRIVEALTQPPPMPWIRWVAYDGDPLPWTWQLFLGLSATVAVSPYGATVIRNRVPGWDPVIIPHGVDLQWFHPPTLEEKREAQQQLFGKTPDWVVGFVGRGGDRKQPLVFFEMAQRLSRDPGMHFIVRMPEYDADVDYQEAVDRFGLYGRVTWMNGLNPMVGVDPVLLRSVYWASDVLVHPALSEGFGLPLVEARACGVPAICTNFSAMADWATPQELVEPAGYVYNGPYQIRQAVPNTSEMVRKVRQWQRSRGTYHQVQSRLATKIAPTDPAKVEALWIQHWDRLVTQAEDAARTPQFEVDRWFGKVGS